MAVIVIMALAAGFILPGVAAADDASRCTLLAAKLRDLDRKARLLARSEGRVECTLNQETHTFLLTAENADERIAAVSAQPGTAIVLRIDGGGRSITFDRDGRSLNYEIEVACGAHAVAYRITGATGHITAVQW